MAINPKKLKKQQELFKKLGLKLEDLKEKFILSSGRGGQKVNKTSACVFLKHQPTGIKVKVSQDRSRETNRYLAREKFLEIYQSQILSYKTKKQKLIEKRKKQKKRRKRKAQKKYSKNTKKP